MIGSGTELRAAAVSDADVMPASQATGMNCMPRTNSARRYPYDGTAGLKVDVAPAD
jgi:hypothetical protein